MVHVTLVKPNVMQKLDGMNIIIQLKVQNYQPLFCMDGHFKYSKKCQDQEELRSMSQFGYYPLVWMNHSRTINNRINGLHKRALSLVYNDFSSSFSELLEKDKSVTIHHRNLQTLAYEIFTVKTNMAPKILTEIFPQKESNYSL